MSESRAVSIIHGWAGGGWHTKGFSGALKTANFNVTDDPTQANIVVAHSVGCYNLESSNNAEKFLLLNPPYWPGRSLTHRLIQKKKHDTQLVMKRQGVAYTLGKFLWEVIYIFAKPQYTWLAIKKRNDLSFLDLLKDKRVVLVRNTEDSYCSPLIEAAAKKHSNVKFVALPGGHDDFYTNPKPYIDLLLKQLR